MNPVLINKADDGKTPEIHRLEELEAMFVSLVDRGANRQSKFFVVKADGTHESDTDLDDSAPDGEAEIVAQQKEKTGEGDGGESTPNDGGDAEEESKADLGSWLEEAGTRAASLLVDHTLEQAVAAAPSVDASKARAVDEDAQVIGKRGTAPSNDHDEDHSSQTEQDLQKARDEAVAKAIEAERLRMELGKRNRDLARERSRVQSLKSTIGAATALPTGESISDFSAERPEGWAGDLAKDDEAL